MKDGQNFILIPKFWDDVYANGDCDKLMTYDTDANKAVYGVCYNFKTESFDYMIAVKGERMDVGDYEVLEVPELTWVKFECRGRLPEAQQNVWKRIFTEWLPTSGYEHDEGPEIEWYSNQDMNSENYLSEIWIPIKKVQN